MENKDMSQYRENRTSSSVVQNWLKNYKQQILNEIIFRDTQRNSFNQEWLETVRNNPECAEIVADTLIGWLNSPVGRQFIRESFDVEIPVGNDGLSNYF